MINSLSNLKRDGEALERNPIPDQTETYYGGTLMDNSHNIPPSTTSQSLIIAATTDDDQLVDLWLRKQRNEKTRESYGQTVAVFRNYVNVGLRALKLDDLLNYADWLKQEDERHLTKTRTLSTATQARKLASIKSLLTFAQEVGYTIFNVGKALEPPKIKSVRAERILSEEDVFRLIGAAEKERDKLLLRMLYLSGARIAELCGKLGASWRDLQPRAEGGQVTLFGKGGKTRVVLLPERLWKPLMESRREAKDDDPLFRSREGRLSTCQAWRIVKKAAKVAGISWAASPHWLRHAHASHALENGASITLVSKTLGHESEATTANYLHARPGESSGTYLKVG